MIAVLKTQGRKLLIYLATKPYEHGIFAVIFTARIRRMGEGTVFSLFVSSHLGGGGVTPVRSKGWGTPSQVWLGVGTVGP